MILKDKYYGQSARIARWKIDNPIENLLARLADYSEICKSLYVFYYRLSDRKYFNHGIKLIDIQLAIHKDQFVKVKHNRLVRDMVYCLHRFGICFEEYCIYYFVQRNTYSRSQFVSDKLRHYYCDLVNGKDIPNILNDKYNCYLHYRDFFKREVLGCYSYDDLAKFRDFVQRHPKFILKPTGGNCGHGVQILSVSTENSADDLFNVSISKGSFVVEELIKQGDEMDSLHPQSINSVRVSTFVLNNTVNIIAAVLRMGKGDSVVDNAGSGGMYASVDVQNGIVQTDARTYSDIHYNFHPDTGVPIIGFQLPHWNEALSLIEQMALKQKGTTLIAWDIAYSAVGGGSWIMVEGNAVGSWDVLQSNRQIGLKPYLHSLLDEYFQYGKKSSQ